MNEWKKNNSFPKKVHENIELIDIGGVGEKTYKSITWPDYKLIKYNNVSKYDILFDKEIILPVGKPSLNKDNRKTGLDILYSLFNLAKDINKINEKKEIENLEFYVIEWMKKNQHPYNIDYLYNKFSGINQTQNSNEDYLKDHSKINIDFKDGRFIFARFIGDLDKLYKVMSLLESLDELEKGNQLKAYNLYKKDACFKDLPIFDQIKKVTKNINEFTKKVLETKKEILSLITVYFPKVIMKTIYDEKANNIFFTADVSSVFDIAWYSLIRLISCNANWLDEDMNNPNINYSSGGYVCCANCGRYFKRGSNRAKYCNDPACQLARGRKNAKVFRKKSIKC